jgi:hypothetical protein
MQNVRFWFFTAVLMKNAVFWDATRVALVRNNVSEKRISPSSGWKESKS